jgi:hypothetical protein
MANEIIHLQSQETLSKTLLYGTSFTFDTQQRDHMHANLQGLMGHRLRSGKVCLCLWTTAVVAIPQRWIADCGPTLLGILSQLVVLDYQLIVNKIKQENTEINIKW